jgi:DNA repair exonuclease SbcCD ATPase subunit
MIYFKSVRWQNFLSTGNQWTEIYLNRSQTTLIVGENGAGKSTLLDAVLFALYGRPYRNINKPLLVNSITGKNCLVEIDFQIKEKNYRVVRGIKPAIFEIYCNDVLVDQNANIREYQEHLEKNILKLNHKSFTQIVVIGSANFTPFMQLKPQERRDVIEDLLDIKIFSVMYGILKQKISDNKNSIVETKHEIDMLEQKVEMTKKHMNEIRSLKCSDREAKSNKIAQLNLKIKESHEKIEEYMKENQNLELLISDHDTVKTKLKKLRELEYRVKNKMETISKEIEFFENNEECPTCQQELDSIFVSKRVDKQKFKIQELEDGMKAFANEYSEINERLEQIAGVQVDITKVNQKIMEENSNIKISNNAIRQFEKEITEEDISDDNYLEELSELEKKIKRSKTTYERDLLLKEEYDIASSMLKDAGIKAKIIKQYIPIINKLVNKYLAAMEFFVQFELDENFNEKIRSRFRDEFTYESFSEGEKMRIDLSLLFTWRTVAKLRNSISTNLLIMDEVFDSSLDNTGTDEFLKIISELSTGTNVFVISHKGDQLFDKFHSVIKFEKNKNFSKIAA